MTVPFLQARSIKLKVSARFPAMIFGRNGITVNKANGNYFVDIDYSRYNPLTLIPPGDVPNLYVLVWNIITGIYELVPMTAIGQVTSLGTTVIVTTSPYTVLQNDTVVVVKRSAPSQITLPLASLHNGPVHISDGNLNAGTNNITITPAGGETIVGLPNWTLAGDGAGVTLYPFAGTGWYL
jgi:hypothetical protein